MIILIITIFLLIMIIIYFKTDLFILKNEGLRDSFYYSLGDVVHIEKFNNIANRMLYRTYFNNSIADEYYRNTNKTSDYKTLYKIVKKRTNKKNIPDQNSIIIHLRIDDVLDIEYKDYKIDDILLGIKTPACYFKTYEYFENNLRKCNIKDVILVGGYRFEGDHYRSEEYVKKIKNYLENLGYNITLRINAGKPDEDFVYLCNSKYYLETGGGFSNVIKEVVRLNNGILLSEQ